MRVVRGQELDCDVLVAGGGAAGVPCALAAARGGARVILCQNRPVLGGNASSEVRMHIVGANGTGSFERGGELETEAREGGIIEEIRLETCVRNPQRSASMLDLILFEKCRAEPNLTLLLNTTVTGVEMEGSRIARAVAERPSTEDCFQIRAGIFIDCTGDGRLGVEAPTHEYGCWWAEWGGTLDTIKDNERIRDELLAIVLGIWDHLKNGPPGTPPGADPFQAAHWALDWFGFLTGKRESRRFLGQHVLTESDVLGSRPFADAIAYGGWSLDLHPPEGIDAPDQPPCTQHPVPHLYDIPLRCCVARDVSNLMFAGRNISATHVAFSSTRVMATCAAVGQGVGTAAAFAAASKIPPAELNSRREAIHAIQQQLLRDDAFLIGIHNQDSRDLASSAAITATSELPGGEVRQVISGQTRSVHGARGAPPDRRRAGTHRWMSDPAAGLPAAIRLDWSTPIHPAVVQLVFDTGLHRHLTLSHHDGYTAKMHWGKPQPETARDYVIDGFDGDAWQQLVAETGNYQRRRMHTLDLKAAVTSLRITVLATNGVDHARICEVRVYSKR